MPTDCAVFAFGLVINISDSTQTRLVWLQRYQWYRKYRTDKHSLKSGTLTMSTVIQPFTRHSALW